MVPRFRFIGFITVALVVGFFIGLSFRQQGIPLQESQSGFVHLLVDFGDGPPAGGVQTWPAIRYVTGVTAFSILKDAMVPIVYDPSTGAGVFVRQIGEKKNGDGGKYWQYWVNGKFAMVAADQYLLHAGDMVEWSFAEEHKLQI